VIVHPIDVWEQRAYKDKMKLSSSGSTKSISSVALTTKMYSYNHKRLKKKKPPPLILFFIQVCSLKISYAFTANSKQSFGFFFPWEVEG